MTKIAFIGGTGPQGMGLAYRFALAGHEIIIGSRKLERAEDAATELAARDGSFKVAAATNDDAAEDGELIVVSIPFEGQAPALPSLREATAGKTVIVVNVPLAFEGGRPSMLEVPEGSAAEQAQALLPEARVAGAFQNLAAKKLWDSDSSLDQDVLVCGDDEDAKRDTMALAEEIRGVRAVDAGPLRSARVIEGLTVLLIGINKRYKTLAGVCVVGIE